MYTVRELVSILGVATENQVRNRIEAIRDLLLPHLRRGPNNQLLLTETGLTLLQDLQALCETGHTLKEAANILRFRFELKGEMVSRGQEETGKNQEKREGPGDEGWRALVEHLAGEVRDLAERVRALEARVQAQARQTTWWESWRHLKIP